MTRSPSASGEENSRILSAFTASTVNPAVKPLLFWDFSIISYLCVLTVRPIFFSEILNSSGYWKEKKYSGSEKTIALQGEMATAVDRTLYRNPLWSFSLQEGVNLKFQDSPIQQYVKSKSKEQASDLIARQPTIYHTRLGTWATSGSFLSAAVSCSSSTS